MTGRVEGQFIFTVEDKVATPHFVQVRRIAIIFTFCGYKYSMNQLIYDITERTFEKLVINLLKSKK
jgi:hypothetical protein